MFLSSKGSHGTNPFIKKSVRKIQTDDTIRVETGALQINDDWKGLFIRGDDAIQLLQVLNAIINEESLDWTDVAVAKAYAEIIKKEVLS